MINNGARPRTGKRGPRLPANGVPWDWADRLAHGKQGHAKITYIVALRALQQLPPAERAIIERMQTRLYRYVESLGQREALVLLAQLAALMVNED